MKSTTMTLEKNTTPEESTTPEVSTPPEESTTLEVSTTSESLSPGAIAGIVVGSAAVGILILLAIIYRKKLVKRFSSEREPPTYIQEPHVRPQKKSVYDESRAAEEFRKLHDYKSTESQTAGLDPRNSSKNRYGDIVPYDFNRVKLHDDGYINASFIEPFFIATQDPMLDQTDPLWQMVWMSKVAVIVRLSPSEEGAVTDSNDGQQRCAVYIPPRKWVVGTPAGNIDVEKGNEQRNEDFVKTELTLKMDECTRQVIHYHIQDWKDVNYPNATVTWNTINKIRETKPSKDRKVLVHCGAGTGRTGTFIALWTLGENHRAKKDTAILDICMKLREQRPGMVTKEHQYDYIYRCAKVLVDGPLMMHV